MIAGIYVVGFETSYLVPDEGAYRHRKIWIESSNAFEGYFKASAGRKALWRRARVTIKACVRRGRFGALGSYDLAIDAFELIRFTEK